MLLEFLQTFEPTAIDSIKSKMCFDDELKIINYYF